MARLNLLSEEYEIDSVKANCGASGGTLYLTNKRVVYVSNMGRELWSSYLENINSHYVNSAMGMYADICITSNGNTEIFRAFKKGGLLFDNSITEVINELFPERESSVSENFEVDNGDDGMTIDFDESDSQTIDDYSNKRGKSGLAIVFMVIAILFVVVFIWRLSSNKGGGSSTEESFTEEAGDNDLVADSRTEAEEIAQRQFEWGGNEGTVLQSQCIMTPEENPYGGYVVQVVLRNGNTRYVKFDDDGMFKTIDSSPVN